MALAPEKFRRLSTVEDTLNDIIRKLNYVFAYLELGDSVNISDKSIKSNHIDFGINSEQVKASNIPIVDSASQYVDDDVEGALAEVMNKLVNQTFPEHDFEKILVSDPAEFSVLDGAISGLTISNPPTQAEVRALRDKCEMLADDCRALRNKVKELIDVLQGYGLI